MLRAAWQRLGLGYIFLLPVLAFVGVTVQLGVELFCIHFGPLLEEGTGRGLHNTGYLEGDTIWWVMCHSESTLLIMLLPWWIGAWALLRKPESASPHHYWRIIFAVSNAVILYVAVLTYCCTSILRRFSLLGQYTSESTLLSSGIAIAFFVFVVLVFVALFRLRTKIPNQ
jgi:hypothetical protein